MYELLINIPGPIEPIDRGERFEDPLFDALEAAAIRAEWLGGGSSLSKGDGGLTIDSCDIELEVEDVARALPVIRRVLIEGGAPPETTISQFEPEKIVHRLREEN